MANASAVPLGDGVSIASGLKTDLGFLLDCNQATYNITSGEAWHLLFIKATRTITEAEPGNLWEFALQSVPVSDIATMLEADVPRLVDKLGNQVFNYINGQALPPIPDATSPHFEPKANVTLSELVTVKQLADFPIGANGSNIRLQYYDNRRVLTLVSEVGTHIYPIAYHRIIGGVNPTAEVVQCARSDFHFWPMPTIPVWFYLDDLQSLEAGIFTEIPE